MSKSTTAVRQVLFLASLVSLSALPASAWSQSDDDMAAMHKRMQNDNERMSMSGYGRRGMSMMGDGMGMMNGMGMMGRGMGMMNMMGGGMGMMGGGMMGMMHGGMSPMMLNMLDLDKDQRAKIRDIMRGQRNDRCKTMNAMMDVRDELAEAYDKDEPNAKAIGKIYQKMFDQKRKMIEQAIETRNKIRGVLNKEQREQFDHMRNRGGMMGSGGMGMMNGGMMGGGMGMME